MKLAIAIVASALSLMAISSAAIAEDFGAQPPGNGLGPVTYGPADPAAQEALQKALEKTRPDGSVEMQSGVFTYPDGSQLKKSVMGEEDDWEIEYKGCGATSSITTKTTKECRTEGAEGKPFWFEIRYVEFVCPDLTPRYRRLAASFKKLGPCKKDEYDNARREADKFGETWTSTDKVVFEQPPTDGKTGDGKTADSTNTMGLIPGFGVLDEKRVTVIWRKDDTWFEATYYTDGTAHWTGKKPGTLVDYPSDSPPSMPTSIGGSPVNFKTATKAVEEPAKPADGKMQVGGGKAGSGKSTEQNQPKKKGKKATSIAAAASGSALSIKGGSPQLATGVKTGHIMNSKTNSGTGATNANAIGSGGTKAIESHPNAVKPASARAVAVKPNAVSTAVSGKPATTVSVKPPVSAKPATAVITTTVGAPVITGGGMQRR